MGMGRAVDRQRSAHERGHNKPAEPDSSSLGDRSRAGRMKEGIAYCADGFAQVRWDLDHHLVLWCVGGVWRRESWGAKARLAEVRASGSGLDSREPETPAKASRQPARSDHTQATRPGGGRATRERGSRARFARTGANCSHISSTSLSIPSRSLPCPPCHSSRSHAPTSARRRNDACLACSPTSSRLTTEDPYAIEQGSS